MNQPNTHNDPRNLPSSGIATRDLVTIGQRWQRRARGKNRRAPLVIWQVYRSAGRYVLAYRQDDPERHLERIAFRTLRAKYRLLEEVKDDNSGEH